MSEPTRLARKREKTRQALLNAARELVYERGHEKISIQDITERADVGLGTFYTYFESKQIIFEAVLDEIRQRFNERLDAIRAPVKDPAMMMALTLKFCLEQAQDNEEWNTFLTYSGLADGHHRLEQNEEQCLQDIQRGVRAGRFKVDDVYYTQSLVMGMVRHVNREISLGRLSRSAMENTARYILRMLGLPDLVAKALAATRLPPVAAPARQPVGQGVRKEPTIPATPASVDQPKLVG
ncbi:MAG: TetR/AcrR family transcriptional regulator [Pseudomonadales bacterium]|nr:TetR/AcrR family transcriptional regulator [Pseudomonadales bacterium]